MKRAIKRLLERFGIVINLRKNLWYLDSFLVLKNLNNRAAPIIFDVGACTGSTVYQFNFLFPDSRIFAFEPFEDSYLALKRLRSKFLNLKTFQFAVSDSEKKLEFYINSAKETNSLFKPKITNSFIDNHAKLEKKIIVDSISLDSFVEKNNIPKIDILKMDVQGGELGVLKGAINLLKDRKINLIYTEIWFLEGYVGQPLYYEIASFLSQYGYMPHGIYNIHYRKKDGHFLWGDAIFYSDCQK